MVAAELITDATSFWGLLEARVQRTPDHPMLLDAADRRVSFVEFRDWAERVAAGLAELGVGEGSPVTWQLPTRIETIVASFALSRLGAVQNPVIHIYRDREVGFCLRQTGATLVLHPGIWGDFDYGAMIERCSADIEHPPRVLEAYTALPEGDPATLASAPFGLPDRVGTDPLRWRYYTSGTTADPKGVQHTDATLIAGGLGLARALGMTPDDVGSVAFPYAHIGGPDYIVTLLASGFPAVLLERFVPQDAVAAFRRHGVTMAGGSTAFYTMLLNEQRQAPAGAGKLLPALRFLSGGGAPKPPEVFYECQAELGVPVCHGYGMTECPMIAQGSPWDSDDQLANTEGAPVQGCDVSVTRPDGSAADPGEEGEVRVAGPMVFVGYTDTSLDADAFDEHGRFRTGDLGVLHPDGHLTLTGRLKDVIIRKGENISAREVEDILYSHPKVAAVAVIGLPDAERGERVCAVVELTPGQEPLTLAELHDHCRVAGLMVQKIPEQLEHVGALPRNATLKVLKFKLKDELADRPWG